jgi:hypothetical protein
MESGVAFGKLLPAKSGKIELLLRCPASEFLGQEPDVPISGRTGLYGGHRAIGIADRARQLTLKSYQSLACEQKLRLRWYRVDLRV